MLAKVPLLPLASILIASPEQGKTSFVVPLSASAEVAEAAGLTGDDDGAGLLKLTVDPGSSQVCYDFALTGLATPLMAHIHRGPAHQNGPSVVTLFTGPGGELRDCLTWTHKWIAAIVDNPSAFYVNISTTEFPDGALRGQLSS